MTGEQLLAALLKMNPEDLSLDVVHVHTEYNSSEDSVGYEVEQDVENVRIAAEQRRGKVAINKKRIVVGY